MRALMRAALVMCIVCFAAAGQAETYTRDQLQNVYLTHLVNEGYRPEVTRAGNVSFKRQGRTYYITVNEKDPQHFRLVAYFRVKDKSPEARLRRLEAANIATRQTKVVKLYLDRRGDLAISAELYQLSPGDANQVLTRIFNAFDLAYQTYLRNF